MPLPVVMIPVSSSSVAELGHDMDNDVLYVRFKKGAVGCYQNVDETLFADLLAEKSVGAGLDAKIKKFPDLHPFKYIPKSEQ